MLGAKETDRNKLWRLTLLVFVLAVFSIAFWRASTLPQDARFEVLQIGLAQNTSARSKYSERFVSSESTDYVHSASAVELSDGRLMAFWFGGSREGASDGAIRAAEFLPERQTWINERTIVTPANVQRDTDRYINKLGNAVSITDGEDRVWLFFVSVSLGGWSGSAINLIKSEDGGRTWGSAQRLATSSFFNFGNLVKGPPLWYDDSSIGLPIYQELFTKLGELVRLSREGEIWSKSRISTEYAALQPVVVPYSGEQAIALLRYADKPPKRVLFSRTYTGGDSWVQSQKTALANPNSAIAALRLRNSELIMVFNNSEDDRNDLSLAYSSNDGESWRVVHTFDQGGSEPTGRPYRYSYPWLLRADGGEYHLFYTWRKSRIKHVQFNQAWLDRLIRK